jgi:hypothetical protein
LAAAASPVLTPEDIAKGIGILRDEPRMTVEAAGATLRAAGIKGENSTLYRLIVAPAYRRISK